jgi:hypothetical protein
VSAIRALAVGCALLIGAGAALRFGSDLFTIASRFASVPFAEEPEWLARVVATLFTAGALLSLPLQIRMAADPSDAGRPWLFAGSGALLATLLIVVSSVVAGLHDGETLLPTSGVRVWQDLGSMTGTLPVLLLLVSLLALAGRVSAAAGALLAAPLVMITVLALTLEVSIVGSTLTAGLPMLLCAGALLPAALAGRRPALAIWPAGAASVGAFAVILFPGLLTPSELAALLLVPAIAAGVTGYLSATSPMRGAWLERAAADLGGLILALIALNLVAMLLVAVPWIIDAKRTLAGVAPTAMLALTFIAYIIVASFATPVVSVAIVLLMVSAAYGGGVPADILVVGLAIATLQTAVTRGAAREPAPSAGSVALPPRQAGWAQILIMVIITAFAFASVLGWV